MTTMAEMERQIKSLEKRLAAAEKELADLKAQPKWEWHQHTHYAEREGQVPAVPGNPAPIIWPPGERTDDPQRWVPSTPIWCGVDFAGDFPNQPARFGETTGTYQFESTPATGVAPK